MRTNNEWTNELFLLTNKWQILFILFIMHMLYNTV